LRSRTSHRPRRAPETSSRGPVHPILAGMHVTTSLTARAHAARMKILAIGAAAAIALGGYGLVYAGPPGTAASFVAITPCRLADTRPASAVGPYTAPVSPGGSYTFTGWGDGRGDCSLPVGTTALELNVTAVNASDPTYLTVYPTGVERPTASHLNPHPGDSPAPNSVTATLDAAGRFDVYNAFGTVDVIIDVVGYYAPVD